MPVMAQGVRPGADRSEYDQAFDAMMADPGNLELTFGYARAAAAAGDYEGAVGALERILLLNPNVPRVRYELGVLYYRLGSFDTAREYLTQARAAPEMPAEVRTQADSYLADIDKRTSRFRFAGTAATGVRYQTNANAGPSSGQSRIFGIDLALDKSGKKKDDWNVFANVTGQAVYDLQNQDGDTVEVNGSAYGTRQSNFHRYDLQLYQLDVGPRFQFDLGDVKPSLRPYLLVNYSQLAGYEYFGSAGAGVNTNATFFNRLFVDFNLENQSRNYKGNTMRARVDDQDGEIRQARAYARYALTDAMGIGALSTFTRLKTTKEYARSSQFALGAIYDWTFKSPLSFWLDRPWRLQASLTRTWRGYDAADSTIDPNNKRWDREWDGVVGLQFGLTDSVAGLLQVERDKVNSNIPNYKYTNTIGIAGLSYKF